MLARIRGHNSPRSVVNQLGVDQQANERTVPMNKRLEMLEKMTRSGQADAFAWYGLAMEYRRLERVDDALGAFESLRALDADYLPQYLMAGQLLIEAERSAEARVWLEQGRDVARAKGDGKTLGELEQALGELGP